MPSFDTISKLFGGAQGADLAAKFENYKGALNKSFSESESGRVQVVPTEGGVKLAKSDTPAERADALLALDSVSKALGADQVASIRQALTTVPDVNKAISLTSPIGTQPSTAAITGLTPFDLEAPAKLLVPVETPLRNKIPRKPGQGNARQYKRITGFSNAQTPTSSLAFPGITDAVATQFNQGSQPSFLRGSQISYAGDWFSVAYQQFSLSDSVYWSAQYAGQGFEDIRQLSQTSVLYASMLAEERMAIGGRGPSAGGYGGQIGTMGTVTAVGSTSGGSLATGTYQLWVAPVAGFGNAGTGIASSVSSGALTGPTASVALSWASMSGATGYQIYATAAGITGAANAHYVTTVTGTSYTFAGPVPSTGATAPTADTSVNLVGGTQVGYDGILPITLNPSISGYVSNINGKFSTTNPGTEFQTAFASMYANNLADPDEVLMNGADRKQLSDLLKGSSSTGFRITIDADGAGGHQLGQIVTAIQNEVTGKMPDLSVHPYFPQGTSSILTHTLPFPNSEVESCWAFVNVQDYMGVSWPVVQFSYDFSSYWYGTFLCYAPAWQGAVTGITAG